MQKLINREKGEGEVLLWWLTLAHKVRPAETCILHHAITASVANFEIKAFTGIT